MSNLGKLIKFEFKKIRERGIFKIIILIAIILPIITSFSEYSSVKNDVTILKKYKSFAAVNSVIENDFMGPAMIMVFALSTVMICEEFSKGTIKQLFIKPFRKDYHFLSKYIVTCFIIFLYCFIFVILSTLIFVFLYHFQNITMPNENLNKDVIYSIPKFMGLNLISLVPELMIYISVLFFWGALSTSPIITIIYGFIFFILDSAIAVLLYNTNIISKFFLNFNLSVSRSNIKSFIFQEEMIEGANLGVNIIMIIIYLLIFITLGKYFFKNKEIHNI